MKKYIVAVITVLVCSLSLANTALPQNMLPKGKWWKHPEVLDDLNLSDTQIQQVEAISNESMKKIIALEAEYKIARLDLEMLLDQADQQKLNLNAIEKQIDALNKARGELEKQRILMLARIRNVLPAEAVKKLKKLRGRLGKKRGKRERIKGNDMLNDYQEPPPPHE